MPNRAIPCARFSAGIRSAMYVQKAVIATAWPVTWKTRAVTTATPRRPMKPIVRVDTATMSVPIRMIRRRLCRSMTLPAQGLTRIVARPAIPTMSPIRTSSAPSLRR